MEILASLKLIQTIVDGVQQLDGNLQAVNRDTA